MAGPMKTVFDNAVKKEISKGSDLEGAVLLDGDPTGFDLVIGFNEGPEGALINDLGK